MSLLNAVGLVKQFGSFRAVDDASLSVEPGSINALIGPNGAGKTTYFYMLAGYLRPTLGRLEFDGHDITGRSSTDIARRGLVCTFQATNLFLKLTVLQCVECAVIARRSEQNRFWSFRGNAYAGEAMEYLHAVGLEHLAEERAAALSHGDQRLLEVAVALAAKPKLLLLDEPTAGMSPLETERTVALIKKLVADNGLSILIVEHDVGVVFTISDTITVLHNGKVLTSGSPEAVRNDQRVQEIYLGTPI
jgi:branched-chain amino acid transport system ATP-binding protein